MKAKSGLKLSKSTFFVILTLALVLFLFAAVSKWQKVSLLKQKITLYKQKMTALDEKAKLLHNEIQSADDPIWLELALMEELGLVPKDSIKLHYTEEK